MSALSAPKLKSDFKTLYKDMRQAGVLKSPSGGLKATLLARRKDLSAKKKTQPGSKDKQSTGKSRTEPSPPIDHLFRSSGKLESTLNVEKEKSTRPPTVVESMRAKTSQDDRSKGSSNIIFNQKVATKGIPSRGNSAISKRKPVGNIEINRDLNFGKPSPHSKPTPVGFKTNVSYKSIGANYSSMFGKKERESSKESRSSQRRPSNNTSSKAQIYKPQLGKEKLTKLLQPSTPSERFMKSTDQAEKARGTAGNSTKRKNSSSNSINKKSNLEPRSSIAGKSTSKIIPVMAGGLSYLSAKSTQDLKKEILANKMIGNMRMIKKPEDTRPTTKGNPTILSSLITQVAKPVAIKHESPQNGATLNTDKSSKTLKKKKKSSKENPAVKLSLKNEGIFYMHKLELSFKECGEDEESSLFRLHFKNTIQSLSLLSSVSKTVAPYEDKQKIHMPPLKSPSIKRNNLDMKTIIFDLDETLIHCNEDQDNPCDARVPVSFPTGDFIEVTMTYRGRNQHPAIRQGGFTGVIKDV